MGFAQTSQSQLAMTGSSVSVALNMSGSPNVAYITTGVLSSLESAGPLAQTSDQLNSIYFRIGATALPVDATNGSLLKPGQGNGVSIPISGGQPAYISAIGANGNALNIVLGVAS